jgi:hypothetical protein
MRGRKCAVASCRWLAASVLLWLSCSAFGQTPAPAPAVPQRPKVMAPHQPIASRVANPVKSLTPAMPRSLIGGLWMTDANFKSAIYIRNIVETDPITVTPILHLSNGVKYTLPNVTVQPAGVAIIDVNQGLQQLGIASYSTLSGYAELQYTWPWDPFCVTIRNVDVAHSMIFTYGLRPALPPPIQLVNPASTSPRQTIEGMWWKHEANVTGFVALANISAQPVQASVQVTDNQANIIAQHNVTVSPQG